MVSFHFFGVPAMKYFHSCDLLIEKRNKYVCLS